MERSPTVGVSTPAPADPAVGDSTMLVGLELYVPITARDGGHDVGQGGGPVEESTAIGEIVEVLTVGDERYVLVDTRHWTYGSRRLVPVSAIERVDLAGGRCDTVLDRDDIRCAPDFDPFHLATSRYRTVLQNYFAEAFRARST